MKIIAITDLHGRPDIPRDIASAIAAADIVLIAGDITHFGGAPDAHRMLENIQSLNENIFAVHGNCDGAEVNQVLESSGIGLSGKAKEKNGVAYYGIGGSIKTPSGTLQEHTEAHFAKALASLVRVKGCDRHVFLSHQPPLNTNLDKTAFGVHVGSRAIREFIERFEPDIAICGHIHEARGTDTIGRTIVINPGPFPGHYAEISWTDNIVYDLH